MKPLPSDMLRGHLEPLLLAAVERGEAHGYEIMQRLTQEARGAFEMKEGTLYPVLYRLEAKGLVRTRWQEESEPRKGPRRRLYRLSSRGRKTLALHRAEWQRFSEVMARLLEASP